MKRQMYVTRNEGPTVAQALWAVALGVALVFAWLGGYYVGIHEQRPARMIAIGGQR
jgi:hypothetical protein